jgi:hypothetical protein
LVEPLALSQPQLVEQLQLLVDTAFTLLHLLVLQHLFLAEVALLNT